MLTPLTGLFYKSQPRSDVVSENKVMEDRGGIIFGVFLERKFRVGNPGSLEGIWDFHA